MGADAKVARPGLVALLSTPDYEVRVNAATALVKIDPTEAQAAEVLLGIVNDASPTNWYRAPAALALVQTRYRTRAIDVLTSLIAPERRSAPALQAYAALPLALDVKIKELVAALRDEDPWVRQVAALELGRLGPVASQALPVLEGVQRDASRFVRWQAGGAVRRIRDTTPITKPSP
jgi:HEAT repeat protein